MCGTQKAPKRIVSNRKIYRKDSFSKVAVTQIQCYVGGVWTGVVGVFSVQGDYANPVAEPSKESGFDKLTED